MGHLLLIFFNFYEKMHKICDFYKRFKKKKEKKERKERSLILSKEKKEI